VDSLAKIMEAFVRHCRVGAVRGGLSALVTCLLFAALPAVAAAAGGTTSYAPGTPAVDGVLNGPWNTSQGDSSEGTRYQSSDLFPTYTPGGNTTTVGAVT
jgi:hypothetical protein